MRIAKVVSAVAGVLIVLGSLTMVAAGTVVLVVTSDSDGYFTAGPIEVETEASALVADDIDIILDEPMPGGADLDADLVRAKISVESRNGKDVFIGVGPAAAIEDYLGDAGPTYVEVFGDDVVLRTVAVTDSATPPATEDFWVASNEGGSLVWDVDEGRWAVAVLNADGSPGVDVAVTAGIRIPFLRPIGVGVLAAGLIGLIVGILLTYFGVRDERRPPAAAPPPPPGPTEPKEPEQATV